MINNSLQSTRISAGDAAQIDALTSNGWNILGSGATIGDNPAFTLLRENVVHETGYDNSFRRREVR